MIATIITDEFKNELKSIINNYNFLSQCIKNDFYIELLNKLQYLEIFPEMYPILIQNPKYRKFIVKKYIVLYEISENKIILTHIFHEKSNFFNNQDKFINLF